MPAIKSSPFISPSIVEEVPATIDAESLITCDSTRDDEAREKWQDLIDQKLIEWGRDPSQLADEGVEPPSGETIRIAFEWANRFSKNGLPPPDSVVPDANGGIVFERREKDVSEVLHVWDDGSVEYQRFHGTRLVERQML